MTLSAWEHQQALAGYRSWAEALLARPPAYTQIISLWHGGKFLHFQRGGNALTTADGSTWGPADGLPVWVQHYDVKTHTGDPDAAVLGPDYTEAMRRAVAATKGDLLLDGFVHISDTLWPNLHCRLHSTVGPYEGGLAMREDHNPSAIGYIATPRGTGFPIGDMRYWGRQSVARAKGEARLAAELAGLPPEDWPPAPTRADLHVYPWAINACEETLRPQWGVQQFAGVTHGLISEGPARSIPTNNSNIGGGEFKLIQDGAFVEGVRIDNSKDFIDIKIRSWPEGSTYNKYVSQLWQDGNKIGLNLLGSDGFRAYVSAFNCKQIVCDLRAAPIGGDASSGSFIQHDIFFDIDGINGSLDWKNGYGNIKVNCQDRVHISGGVVNMASSDLKVFRNNAAALRVSGGAVVNLSSSSISMRQGNVVAAQVEENGTLCINGLAVIGPGGAVARAQDTIKQIAPVAASEATAAASWAPATDTITVPSNTDKWMTGMAVQVTTSGALPDEIIAGRTYYVIRVSATAIKLAATYAQALAGTAFNFTGAGTGTHTIARSGPGSTLKVKGLDALNLAPTAGTWLINVEVDKASHNIECPPNYAMKLPAGHSLGRYIQQSRTV